MKKTAYLGRRRVRWPWVALALLLLIGAVYLTRVLCLTALGQWLVQADGPASADAVLVLAGDFSGGRVLTGADLVKRGFAPKALVSGPNNLYGHYESEYAIQYAVSKGYPESYFVACPNESLSTRSEAVALIPRLRTLHVHRLDLVTSSYHTRRAASIYRSLAPDLELHVIAAPDSHFHPNDWWKDREGRKTFLVESIKTVAYWFGL